jgi:alkylhydroperoxidase/carboxymuconolactone decarboxylase family protein YurZ
MSVTSSGESFPLLEQMMSQTLESYEESGLDAQTYLKVRIAALAALGANPASWLLNLKAAADSGLTPDDVQAVLIGIAPVIGTARTVAATTNALRAIGAAAVAAAVAEADEEG